MKGHQEKARVHKWEAINPDTVVACVDRFHVTGCGGDVTFNLLCYQDGRAIKTDMDTMKTVKQKIRKGVN